MRVVLPVALELLGILAEDALKHVGAHHAGVAVPHFRERLCVGHYQAPLCAERVLLGAVHKGLEVACEEELGEFVAVAQTLQTAVHVTSVAQVSEAHLAIFAIFGSGKTHLLQLVVDLCRALRLVEPLVALHALVSAVTHALALADSSELVADGAPLALADEDPLLLLVGVRELGRSHLDKHDLVVERLLLKIHLSSNEGLERLAGEGHTAVGFFLALHVLVLGGLFTTGHRFETLEEL